MYAVKKLILRTNRALMAFLLLTAQMTPFFVFNTQRAYALNEISAGTHQGQLNPSGSYSSGNTTTYKEGDSINYRFTVDSSVAASGQMQVEFTSQDTGCTFFDGSLVLGTWDNSAQSVEVISGTAPNVSLAGSALNDGSDWMQKIDFNFTAAGEATIYYYLTLTDEAGECSSGSPQHSRLANSTNTGAFKNIGNQNVPIPASQIIELPEIFIEKYVDTDGDGITDRPALAGEWTFTLDGVTSLQTNSQGKVTFVNVEPNGNHTITESNGPSGQVFLSGGGTNCNFNGSVATANVVSGTTSTNATCVFNNGIQTGSIIIEKQTLPDGDPTSFSFTPSYGSAFNLSDGQTNNSGALVPGLYSVAETVPAGWDLTRTSCSDGSPVTAISLQANETVTCTFTNTKRGQLIVQKTTLPVGDVTQFTVDVNTTNGGVIGDSQGVVSDAQDKIFTVTPGTYSVEETAQQGWTKTADTCQNVVVAAGQTKYCEITNTKLASITIVKDALPANDGTLFPFTLSTDPTTNFSLDDDSATLIPDNKTYLVLPGIYTITEDLSQLPWVLTSINCGDKSFSSVTNGLSITVSAGDVVSCAFTNTKFGSISGTKYEVNADGTLANPSAGLAGWTIELFRYTTENEKESLDTEVTDVNGHYFFTGLLPGNYEVIEVLQTGWTQITPTGDGNYDVTLSAGQNSTNNDFGNFENGTIRGYKWNDINGDGNTTGEPKLSGWTIFIDINGDKQLDSNELSVVTDANGEYEFTNVAPGAYKVCEVLQTGWVQTYPGSAASPGCQTVVMDTSGATLTANFGNQGRGTITVIKDVVNDDGGKKTYADFSFSVTSAIAQTPNVNGNYSFAQDGADHDDGKRVITQVPAGTFSITEPEANTMGYATSYSYNEINSCTQIIVLPNQNATCTITNDDQPATLIVEKKVIDNGRVEWKYEDFSFTLDDGNPIVFESDGSNSFVVLPGTYKVEEIATRGYETTYKNDCSEITIKNGETKYCKIINEYTAPRVHVAKHSCEDCEDSTEFDFELFNNGLKYAGFGLSNSKVGSYPYSTVNGLKAGAVSVVEKDKDGWYLKNANCYYFGESDLYLSRFDDNHYDNKVYIGTNFTAENGIDYYCDFYNEKTGNIVVTKFNDLNNNGKRDEGEPTMQGWEINVEGVGSKVTGADGTVTFSNLKPDNYAITETMQAGWVQTVNVCANSDTEDECDVEAGITVYCIIGNYKTPPTPSTPAVLSAVTPTPSPVVLATTGENVSYEMMVGLTLIAATVLTALNRRKFDTVK